MSQNDGPEDLLTAGVGTVAGPRGPTDGSGRQGGQHVGQGGVVGGVRVDVGEADR
jgi:hypothetical protein